MKRFADRIRPYVDRELNAAARAEAAGDAQRAFSHLERAHVLGQASTQQHVRVHTRMLLWAWRQRRARELRGQLLRVVAAATKTAFGWVPQGNTGGTNVSPVAPMPIAPDLQEILRRADRR